MFELLCEKTYLLTCEPNEYANKPAHLRRLTRVLIVHMKKICITAWLSKMCSVKNLIRLRKKSQADLNLRWVNIMKTCLYNFDPHKPHFYIVKLGFTGVYIIFLISAQKHRLWYSLEPPHRGGSNEYPQSMF